MHRKKVLNSSSSLTSELYNITWLSQHTVNGEKHGNTTHASYRQTVELEKRETQIIYILIRNGAIWIGMNIRVLCGHGTGREEQDDAAVAAANADDNVYDDDDDDDDDEKNRENLSREKKFFSIFFF